MFLNTISGHAYPFSSGRHWTISLLKRWLLGTHAGAVRDKHLQAYLDEFAFRHNRRKTNGVGRIAARVSRASSRDRR